MSRPSPAERLADLRARAAERVATMRRDVSETAEEIAERADVSEAMRRLQARSSSWRDDDERGYVSRLWAQDWGSPEEPCCCGVEGCDGSGRWPTES